MMTVPVGLRVQELEFTLKQIIPNITEVNDVDMLRLVEAIERAYAHVLIEAAFRGVVEY
jgi:hypothetical protein